MVAQRIVAHRRCDKVTRNDFGSLMNQLIERVLTVSTWLTPNDWAGLIVHWIAVTVNVFTVGFHVALLEVSGKAVHVLVIWQDSFGFGAVEIVVPDTDQRQQNGQVLLQIGRAHV